MTNDDLKKYSVVVDSGSGCLFQPMTTEYTYVLTAKHLLYNTVDDDAGQKTYVLKENGEIVQLNLNIKDNDSWRFELIELKLELEENYFLHDNGDVDLAILKIPYRQGYNVITTQGEFEREKDFFLCGFPVTSRSNPIAEWYQSKEIRSFGASGNCSISAQLDGNFAQQDIEGMSGCGILKLNMDGISLIGIQSKMASKLFPMGAIGFVPIKYAIEIINYERNSKKLQKLFPNTLSNFSFLRDKAFILDVDQSDFENADGARMTLMNKAQNIINSDITPYGIKELFRGRLLISEYDDHCLSLNPIWIAWLEFLTIMNIVKYDVIDSTHLSAIFNTYRLKYVNADDWTDANLKTEYGSSDYLGIPPDSTIIISSKNPAKSKFKIPKGKLINIGRPYDKNGFRTDKGIDPFTSFDFVHIDYFKTKCIIQKIDDFEGLSELEIITKLKDEFRELFN